MQAPPDGRGIESLSLKSEAWLSGPSQSIRSSNAFQTVSAIPVTSPSFGDLPQRIKSPNFGGEFSLQ